MVGCVPITETHHLIPSETTVRWRSNRPFWLCYVAGIASGLLISLIHSGLAGRSDESDLHAEQSSTPTTFDIEPQSSYISPTSLHTTSQPHYSLETPSQQPRPVATGADGIFNFDRYFGGAHCSTIEPHGYVDPYKYGCCPSELPEFEVHRTNTESLVPVIINSNMELLLLLEHFRNKKVLFLGDSLSGQTFDAFLLGARSRGIPDTGTRLLHYYVTDDPSDYRLLEWPDHIDLETSPPNGGVYCIIEGNPVQCSISKVFVTEIPSYNMTVVFGQLFRLMVPVEVLPVSHYMSAMAWTQAKSLIEEANVIMINIGLHSVQETFAQVLDFVTNEILQPLETDTRKIVYRQSYPQHFDEPSGFGYYTGPGPNLTCTEHIRYPPYQVDTVNEALSKTTIPTLHTFKLMQSMGLYHFPTRQDCTHYCYTPSIWNAVWYLWREALGIVYSGGLDV